MQTTEEEFTESSTVQQVKTSQHGLWDMHVER